MICGNEERRRGSEEMSGRIKERSSSGKKRGALGAMPCRRQMRAVRWASRVSWRRTSENGSATDFVVDIE